MNKKDKGIMEHFKYFVDKDVRDYATNVVLNRSKYIFISGKGKVRRGYCTHCKKSFSAVGYRHKEKILCPKCSSECEVKSIGYSRQYLRDSGSFLEFKTSPINSKVVIGIYFIVSRDYRKDYKGVRTKIIQKARYYFEVGNAAMYCQCYRWSHSKERYIHREWTKAKGIYHANSTEGSWRHYDHVESFDKAIQNTPFEPISKCFLVHDKHSTCDETNIKRLGLYCKHPEIEYIVKAGHKDILNQYLYGWTTYRTLNWRARTSFGFFGISKETYQKIKSDITFEKLKLIQLSENKKYSWNMYEIEKVLKYSQFKKILILINLVSPAAFIDYVEKQAEIRRMWHGGMSDAAVFDDEDVVISDWVDYIKQCKELNYDLTNKRILMPRDIFEAHQRLTELIQYKANKEMDLKLKKRVKSLEKMTFQYNGLMIRPAASSQELIDEGKSLGHCVGGYVGRYARGELILLFLRKSNKPTESYFTVEVRGNKVTQARGYKNKSYTRDKKVNEFIQVFTAEVLNKNKKERKAS